MILSIVTLLFFSYSCFQTDDDYLNSKTISVSSDAIIYDGNWPTVVTITFDRHCLVSGIIFDNSDMIKKFTVSYTLNGKNVAYKDHHYQEQATVRNFTKPVFTCLKPAMETPKEWVKSVQS